MKTKNEGLRFNTPADQNYCDPWDGGRVKVCRYAGRCMECGVRTYYFTDGGNDPRGILGRHTSGPIQAHEYNMTGPNVPACFDCGNDRARYERLMVKAKKYWDAVAFCAVTA